jgi:small subunit ribosomal protein S17
MPKKQLQGTVVSDKMQKTVVVSVERIKESAKYKRKYKMDKKYKAHVNEVACQTGDKVAIEECLPISKEKRWVVVKKIAAAEKLEKLPEVDEVETSSSPSAVDETETSSPASSIAVDSAAEVKTIEKKK